jgi:hypothetical protein
MTKLLISIFILCSACKNENSISQPSELIVPTIQELESSGINCTDEFCSGEYNGPEFIDGADVAHQFSNTMSKAVGDQLKELYQDKTYSKVDFTKIEMTTKGMGSGQVLYKLYIPFQRVLEECEAYTSFDHVGGWNHSPALSARKTQLSKALLPGERLDISELKTTNEGLHEYWIQWKNKEVQSACGHN